MKTKYTLFRRGGVFYAQESATGKQTSLRTKDETEAKSLLNARNEAQRQPVLNLHLARAYLTASDPAFVERTWQPRYPRQRATRTGFPARLCRQSAFGRAWAEYAFPAASENFWRNCPPKHGSIRAARLPTSGRTTIRASVTAATSPPTGLPPDCQ